ncbi:MAG: FAD-dependent oxidoreductase [Deltaproteobacteria bacterium]|nr:FAD-dependent oxidoreductase [Deltaproteobacteria bacterium]
MKQLSLMIDLNRCIGCRTCIVACRNYNEIIDHATDMPNEMPYYLRVESRIKGTFPDIAVDTWVVPCQQCGTPNCVDACPEGAISKDPQTGVVRIDKDTCNGCNAVEAELAADKSLTAPCKVNCPAHMNVQGYVQLAAKGKFQEALKLMKEDNPLPAICGRICDHPCESNCNRSEIDEPVAINAIKRFVADLDLNAETRYVPEVKEKKDDKVAVVGAGPAGLSCAYFLAREGYQVTIFEKETVTGGMLTTGIPAYRLPRDLIEAEIQAIRDMGVDMKTGVEFGKDVTIDQLRQEGYKSFFIGIGAQECKALGVEGEDLEGVHSDIDLLRKVNLGEPTELGKRVAVIGGGNSALDAVRSARRLGGTEACIIYRRSLDEMPAIAEEIKECQDEGIPINTLTQPIRIIGENGRVTQIECVKMQLGEPDESGRRTPEPISGSEFTIEVDDVITALGQETDWACLTPECACQLTDWGTMKVDPVTFQSDDPDIFAGGDAVTGPRTVIEAIAGGKEAAISIDRFVRGKDLLEGRKKEWDVTAAGQKEKYHPAKRASMPVLKPEERVSNFDEVQLGLTEEMVVEEAKRCLGCGSACMQACPYDVIQFDLKAGVSHKCDLCSDRIHAGDEPVCTETCMTDAITFGEYDLVRQSALADGRTIMEDLSRESILYIK